MLFLGDEQIERARTDRSYPRDRIVEQLEYACSRHLDASYEHLRTMSPIRNLMVWHAFVTELALLHVLTDDERPLEHLAGFLRGLTGDGWRTVETTEHLHAPFVLTGLAACADLLGDRLAPGDRDQLHATTTGVAEFLWDDLQHGTWGTIERTVWNHNAIAYAAIGVAGLALPDHPRAGEWAGVAAERARRFLEVGVTAAGMTWEGHHYCGYVFQHLGLFLRGLRGAGRIGEVAPAGSALEAKLHRVPHWYAHDLFPRGKWLQNYNDSHWDPSSSLLGFLLTFTEYEPALCAAVWDQLVGKPGRRTFGFDSRFSSVGEALLWFPDDPIRSLEELGLDDHFHCPEVGYVAARTGWDRGASVFTFNSGPLIGVVHHHADNNAFTYIARGAPLALDSGSANDATPGSPSTAAGHNGVFVDGRGEAIAGGGAGVSGRILAVAVSDDAVGVVGDATESYTVGGHLELRRAHRHALFVRRPVPYLVTFDDLDVDDREHRFEYTVHVPSGDAGDTAGACTIGSNTGDPVGRLQVLHPDPASVELATEPYATQRRPRGPHNNHVRWSLETTATRPDFVVLYLPQLVPGEELGGARVERRDDELVVRLTWPAGTDELAFTIGPRRGAVAPPALRR